MAYSPGEAQGYRHERFRLALGSLAVAAISAVAFQLFPEIWPSIDSLTPLTILSMVYAGQFAIGASLLFVFFITSQFVASLYFLYNSFIFVYWMQYA